MAGSALKGGGLNCRVDAGEALSFLDALGAGAGTMISTALNRTAELATRDERQGIRERMTVRSRQALNFAFPQTLKGATRATPDNLRAIVEPEKIGQIYSGFEEGEPKTTDALGRLPLIPSFYLRPPSASQVVIPRRLFPHNLGLTPYRDAGGSTFHALGKGSKKKSLKPRQFHVGVGQRRKLISVGKDGTFMVQTARSKGPVVLKRLGPGKGNVQALWFMRPTVKRPPVLHAYQTMEAAADAYWGPEMGKAFDYFSQIHAGRSR